MTQRLILTNTYFVGLPTQTTVTVQDTDPLSTNVVVAAINGPSGIDYHPVNTSLIISRNDTSGSEKNFKQLASNGFVSDWSSASGLNHTTLLRSPQLVRTSNWRLVRPSRSLQLCAKQCAHQRSAFARSFSAI